MKHALSAFLLLSLVGSLGAQEASAPRLSREAIDSAIARGKASDKDEMLVVRPGRINLSGTGFVVQVEGPGNRIANYTRRQIKKYLQVADDSIPELVAATTLTVVATPLTQVTARTFKGDVVTPAATHMVLAYSGTDGEKVIQPSATELFDVEVNGMSSDDRDVVDRDGRTIDKGRTDDRKHFSTKGIRASFPLSALPAGDFQIRIVTDSKEFRVEVDGRRRAAIQD